MSVEVALALVVASGVAVLVAVVVSTLFEDAPDSPCRNCDPEAESTRHHCVACRPELALAYAPEQ